MSPGPERRRYRLLHSARYEVLLGINSEAADLIYTPATANHSPEGDHEYLRTLALQISNLLQIHFDRCREQWLDDVEAAFVEVDLLAQQCLEKLTERLPNVFPRTRLLNFDVEQAVQLVLRRKRHDPFLRIAASTGAEAGTVVGIDDSVVGMVFETSARAPLDIIYGNPGEPPLNRIYKGFYSNIRSELCLPLRADGRWTIGALNFESPELNAYGSREVKYLLWMAPRLMRIVDALRRQMDSDEHARRGVASAQTTYWEAVAKIMSHDLMQPATTIRLFAAGASKGKSGVSIQV